MFESFYYRVNDLPEKPSHSLLAQHIRRNLYGIFFEKESRVNLYTFFKNPIKNGIRDWFISKMTAEISGEIKYQLIYKHILNAEGITDTVLHEAVRDFVGDAANPYKFQDLYDLMRAGHFGPLGDKSRVWLALNRTRRWSELWHFRFRPAPYIFEKVWERTFGHRGYDYSERVAQALNLYNLNPNDPRITALDPLFHYRKNLPWVKHLHLKKTPIHPLHIRGVLHRFTPRGFLQPIVQKSIYKPLKVGKYIGAVKKAARSAGKKVAEATVLRPALKVALSRIGSALLGGLGVAGGPVTAVAGVVLGEFVGKIADVVLKPLFQIFSAACLLFLTAYITLFVVAILALKLAFQSLGVGGDGTPGPPGESALVEINKMAEPPGPFANLTGGKSQEITYKITITNKSDTQISNVKVTDSGPSAEFAKICPLGNIDSGKSSDPALCTFKVTLKDLEDTYVTNTASVEAEHQGEKIRAYKSLHLEIGSPKTLAPCGWPVPSRTITQYCNPRHKPNNAIDIGAMKDGTPVTATMDGIATRCVITKKKQDYSKGYGIYIWLENEGYASLYAHLLPEPDDPPGSGQKPGNCRRIGNVKKGDAIGLVDNTGNSLGTHLHYEVYRSGQLVCPHPISGRDSFIMETVADCKR